MLKQNIKIAIIDDGVNTKEIHFANKIKHYTVKDKKIVQGQKENLAAKMSHGTICALLIDQRVSGVQIISIQILDKDRNGTCENLCLALRWCMEQKIKIINLSMGTTYFKDFDTLNEVCEELTSKKHIIIAAGNNNGKYTLPAVLPYVIGVAQKYNIWERILYFWIYKEKILERKEYIYVQGKKYISFVDKKGKKRKIKIEKCNSYACAYITAVILKLYQKGKEDYQIKRRIALKEGVFSKKYRYLYGVEYLKNKVVFVDSKYSGYDNIKERIYAIEELQRYKDKSVDLFVVQKDRMWMKQIKQYTNKIRSIICFSYMPISFQYWARKNHIIICEQSLGRKKLKQKISCPIIKIIGNIEGDKIGVFLKKRLKMEGCFALCVSDQALSILDGYMYEKHVEEHLGYIFKNFQPDIMFINTISELKKIEEDGEIFVTKDEYIFNKKRYLKEEKEKLFRCLFSYFYF